MDYYFDQQKLQSVEKQTNYHFFVRKTLHLLVSFSLFCFFLSYSSGISFRHNSIHFYFRTFLFPFFSRTLERKYMFLICNGILAVLARTLGFSTPSQLESGLTYDEDGTKSVSDASNTVPLVVDMGEPLESGCLENNIFVPEEEDSGFLKTELNETRTMDPAAAAAEEEAASDVAAAEEESLVAAAVKEAGSLVIGAVKEEEGFLKEGNEEDIASTEELNKKFDEFIRKMKEELRIQAQQQLIAV